LQSIIKLFIIKTDYKNLIGFLITKKLNKRQVKWVEILIKYYFKIKYIKGINNAKANIFNKRIKL